MGVERQVRLDFGSGASSPTDLSAVHREGDWLWLAADELAQLERLKLQPDGSFGDHRVFSLTSLVTLPDDAEDPPEVDLEGLDCTGDHLWVVGSHSRTRTRVKPKDAATMPPGLARLALREVTRHRNREVLVRLELEPTSGDPEPVRAAMLSGDLTKAIKKARDPYLAAFLGIPSKDNGLDIEGLAAFEDRLLLGLRGPVLRGWAVVLEVRPRRRDRHPDRLELGSPAYRTYFLDLDGLGVRDLCRDGDDVLVLAGPTMDLDGPARVYRWREARSADPRRLVCGDEIGLAVPDVPFGDGNDHAEGITLLSGDGATTRLLTVYDSPAKARRLEGGILADSITVS